MRILIAEDDQALARFVRQGLEAEHYSVDVVSDGEQARTAAVESPYDMVILDLNLPRMSGREVLYELKSDPERRNIPVVVLTTSKSEEDVAKSYCLHANCYITKPVDFAKFIDVVRSINEFWFGVVTLPPVRP